MNLSFFEKDLNKCHFRTQEPGEEILRVIRRHWFNIFIQYIPIITCTLLLWFSAAYGPELFPSLAQDNQTVFWFFITLMGIFIWIFAALIFVDYYLDVWILTDRRVVNIEQKGLFMREISELYYQKIQDVTTEIHGLIPTLLNYGDVYVQTAAEQSRFLFHKVPDPNSVKAQLMEMQKRNKNKDWKQVSEMFHKKMAE